VGAGLTIPRPRTKETGFPRTRTHTQLNWFFPVKYGAGRTGLSGPGSNVMPTSNEN